MATRETKVKLSAQVQEYISGMEQAAKATRATGTEAEKLSQQRESMELMGRAMLVAGGAVAAGLALSAKAAIDWESAWAGVTKTVDGTPEQLEAVESGLRDLTKVLPSSHAEIAAVAEAAGQLGIQTPNVVAFTRTMIDLGETTNLAASDAATQLARFMTVMGTSQDKVSGLGSALVDLGNNYATTEAEIMAMAMRLSGAGAQINMTEGQVLGLSTALSSVGIEAEAGGSAMSKVMIDIASSVDKGGDRVKMFAEVAGMSADAFSDKWKAAPGEALAAFVKGLANAESQGKSTFGILEELGITEVRMRDALLRSSSAADQFSAAMEQGNKAMAENTALTAEAEKRYETTASKLEIVRNQIVDAAIGIGEQFLPLIEEGAESVGGFADMLGSLEGPMAGVVAWGGAIVTTGLLGGGIWMAAVPQIAKYRAAMVSLELAGGRLDRTLRFLGKTAAAGAIFATVAAFAREAETDVTALSNSLERGAKATELLDKAAAARTNQGWGRLTAGIKSVEVDAKSAAEALDYMGDASVWKITPINYGDIKNTLGALKLLGNEMAKIGETDVPRMQNGLKGLSDELGWTDEQQWQFIENSPDLRKALESSAAGFDLSTEKADLLKIAFGGVSSAAGESADGADSAKEAAAQLSAEAETAAGSLDDMRKVLQQIAYEALAMGDAKDRALSAINSLKDAAASEGATLKGTNDASIALRDSMRQVETSHRDSAAAIIENRGSMRSAMKEWRAGREAVIEQRVAMGDSRAEARKWADANLGTASEVKQALRDVKKAADDLDGKRAEIKVTANAADAIAKIQDVNAQLAQVPATKTISISAVGGVSGLPKPTQDADGAIHAYADGGISTGIYKGGTPIIKFAEPETGWEAFISGKASQRDRNRQIWVETGNRLGMNAGGQTVVHVPSVVEIKDADGQLVGRMKVEASRAVDTLVDQQAQNRRNA